MNEALLYELLVWVVAPAVGLLSAFTIYAWWKERNPK